MLRRVLAWAATSLLVSAASVSAALTDVRVNEFVASNATGLADEDGERSDWIELYNGGPTLESLDGAYLTDTAGNPIKWRLPAVDLAPGGFLVVFASGKDRAVAGAELHTNFRLGQDGEYLALVAPDGSTVLSAYAPAFPPQATDVAYGIGPGGAAGYLDPPTPGAANPPAFVDFVLPIEFSEPHGFYDAPFDLELSTPTAGAEIRWTTDGSAPTVAHGTVYVAPIPVTQTTVLRAAAFKPGLQPTAVVSHTMIFVDDVVQQTGQGFPSYWGTRLADYAMDPSIVNHAVYGAEIRDDLKAVPTVSIVTDVADLFGADGIYSHPKAQGDEWERPASVELIYPDGRPGFQANCGLEVHGNTSRVRANPKHSLRVSFKAAYGPSTLNFALFPGSPVTEHRHLVLRAAWQDGWLHARGRALYLRDQLASDTQLALGQVAVRGMFVHVYLNGLYWGLYDLHERATDWFAAFYFGGDHDEWDVIKDRELDEGERTAWDALNDLTTPALATPEGYAAIQQYLDVDNLIDYVMTHHYLANQEWVAYNWVAARRRLPGEGFKFFSWDSERTLRNERLNSTLTGRGETPTGIFRALRLYSPEFRQRFADHVRVHYLNGGALTPAAATARFLARADEIYAPLVPESARWGDGRHAGRPWTREDWIEQRDLALAHFFPVRSAIVLEQYRRLGLYSD